MLYNRRGRIPLITFCFIFAFGGFDVAKESIFQNSLIKRIKKEFPGSYVIKNDPNYIQGFPDITILYKDKWAVLECKKGKGAKKQANQEYYVEELNSMSYSAFVSPENKEEILDELHKTFGA